MTEKADNRQSSDFLLHQYIKLREEIQYRTGIQQQLVALAVIGAGAALTVGTNGTVAFGIPALLLYPVLVMFLAIAWSTQYATIRDLGTFITRLEDRVFLHDDAPSLGWETVLRLGRFRRERTSVFMSGWLDAKGIFIGIQLLALALAVARSGISVEAFRSFAAHPEIIRPYLWTISLGMLDVVVLAVTLSLPKSHPSMRRSVFQLAPEHVSREEKEVTRPYMSLDRHRDVR